MNFKLRVWRQNGPDEAGQIARYEATNIPAEASFLEMLDIVNNGLEAEGEEPIAAKAFAAVVA
jgi:succinate dehydrogenase / fumarate reductase, iron-sulfur subunit